MPKRATSTSFGGKSGNRQGRGPAKGAANAGAPTQTFIGRMKVILERAKTAKSIETILADPDHKHFANVLDTALDRTEGRPPQSVDVTSKGKAISGVVVLPATEAP